MDVGAGVTYPVTGNSADIWYLGDNSTGTLTYRVDSGPTNTVSTARSAYYVDGRVQNVSLGSTGFHTITISAPQARVYLGGLTVYRGDRDKGIRVYDSAYSGATVGTFLAQAAFQHAVAAVGPDVVTIELGLNDYLRGTSPAQFKTQLQNLIAPLKRLPKKTSVLLVVPYALSSAVGDAARVASYGTYVQQQRDVAAADPTTVALLDLSKMMPVSDTTGTGYYRPDGLHPNDAGHQRIADIVTTTLS